MEACGRGAREDVSGVSFSRRGAGVAWWHCARGNRSRVWVLDAHPRRLEVRVRARGQQARHHLQRVPAVEERREAERVHPRLVCSVDVRAAAAECKDGVKVRDEDFAAARTGPEDAEEEGVAGLRERGSR